MLLQIPFWAGSSYLVFKWQTAALHGRAPRWPGDTGLWLPLQMGALCAQAFWIPVVLQWKNNFLECASRPWTERLGNDGKRLAFVTKEDLSGSAFQNPAAKILLLWHTQKLLNQWSLPLPSLLCLPPFFSLALLTLLIIIIFFPLLLCCFLLTPVPCSTLGGWSTSTGACKASHSSFLFALKHNENLQKMHLLLKQSHCHMVMAAHVAAFHLKSYGGEQLGDLGDAR